MSKSGAFLLSLLTLVAGAAGGYYAATMGWLPEKKMQEAASVAERRPLFYRNPMNPAVTSPIPAKDEMGMDYVPVYADAGTGAGKDPAGTVSIDPVTVQNIGSA